MKYVFFGTPRFAEIVLGRLLDAGMVPAAVVCNPDRPVGRKQIVTAPPVREQLTTYNKQLTTKIGILQPEQVADIYERLIALEPDLFIIAAYAISAFVIDKLAKGLTSQ
mgnify:CR=1 FL=1